MAAAGRTRDFLGLDPVIKTVLPLPPMIMFSCGAGKGVGNAGKVEKRWRGMYRGQNRADRAVLLSLDMNHDNVVDVQKARIILTVYWGKGWLGCW